MTRAELVHHVAKRMLHVERPLIDGRFLHEPNEGSPLATWDAADPFQRSEYTRRAHRHMLETEPFVQAEVTILLRELNRNDLVLPPLGGVCDCLNLVGLPAERLKNPNIRECQRCGGAT